jgi:ComF family protein
MWLDFLTAAIFDGRCARCGVLAPFPTCSGCTQRKAAVWTTPAGHSVVALGLYEDHPGRRVSRLKYQKETMAAARLGWALGTIAPPSWRRAQLAPVPLHPSRLAERGFNQAALLAKMAGQRAQLSVNVDLLRRRRATGAQARLSPGERATNLRGAFETRAPVAGSRVVLIDDVVTTGHTVDECAAACTEAGIVIEGVLACALSRMRDPQQMDAESSAAQPEDSERVPSLVSFGRP